MNKNLLKCVGISIVIMIISSVRMTLADEKDVNILEFIPSIIPQGSPSYFGTVTSAGQIWMDRNLGASRVATSLYDVLAYGDLYQWED